MYYVIHTSFKLCCLDLANKATFKLIVNRREGFPRPAYFIPGCDGDGGLARFQSCSSLVVVGIGGFSSKM